MDQMMPGHLPEKRRHFVFPKTFCALGLGLRLGLEEIRFRSNVHSGKSTRSRDRPEGRL